jgi:hypothetical protein
MFKKVASGLFLLVLLPRLVFSQTIEENLWTIGSLIDNSLFSIESMTKDNEVLTQTLENLKASLQTQSALLIEQGRLLNEQELNYSQQRQIYETQKEYLSTLQVKYKVFKVSLIIAVPTCIGLGVWLGWTLASK